MTPAEEELLGAIAANAKDGAAENLRRIAIKHEIDYGHAKIYKRRLMDKGLITSYRCGTGCKCPITMYFKNEKETL